MLDFFRNSDPYFLVLAGLMGIGLLYTFCSSIYESVSLHIKFKKYASKLPDGELIQADCLCSILEMSPERLKEITGKTTIRRYEAEKIIKDMISSDWW